MSILDNIFPNGLGESSGDALVTGDPLYTNAEVYYVSSVLGSDSNAGTERLQPLATIGAAYTAAASAGAGSIIVLAADHDETLTSVLLLSVQGLVIVGAGTSGGQPTATLRIDNALGAVLLDVAEAQVEIRNILFPTCVQANSGARVNFGGEGTAEGGLVKGCKFEHTELDEGPGVLVNNADDVRIVDTTFVVTSAATAPPNFAVEVVDAAVTGLGIENCVLDGGTMGFEDGIAVETSASTITTLIVESTTLLRGSDISVGSATTGRINVSATGSGRVFIG